MKAIKTIVVIAAGFFLSSFSDATIKFKKADVDRMQLEINSVYEYVQKSNLPHQDVVEISKVLTDVFRTLSASTIDSTAVDKPKGK